MIEANLVKELKAFGRRVKHIRSQLKLTQKNFARGLGISDARLSDIESGKGSPTFPFFFNISAIYRVSADYLLAGEGDLFLAPELRRSVEDVTGPLAVDTPAPYRGQISGWGDVVNHAGQSPLFRDAVLSFASEYSFGHARAIGHSIEDFEPNRENTEGS